MNARFEHSPSALPEAWAEALDRRGFRRAQEEEGYRHNGVLFRPGDRWLTFSAGHLPGLERMAGTAAKPLGLWTQLRGSMGSRNAGRPAGSDGAIESRPGDSTGWVFELPAALVSRQERDEFVDRREDASLGAYLDWVLASAHNCLPEGWSAPERVLVESWLPPGAWTLQHGTFLRQGELILEPERWTLRFPVASDIPAELPVERQSALNRVITRAQGQWRMVRLGVEPAASGPGCALWGEVDLSGAPHVPSLFLAGLDALRHVVLWLVETVDLLTDVSVTIRSLAICCPNTNPIERSPV